MHRFNAFVFAVVVWSGAVAPGCARFDIPEGTPIACSADDDCPTDYACRIDRCLPVTSESVPPAVSSATVNTATVGVSGDVTVALVANETLALAPVLSLVTADRRRAFTVVLDDDGTHANAQLTVLRDDLSGAAQIVATLVDLAGNQANDVLVGTVVLDTIDPRSTAVGADNSRVSDDDTVIVTVTASEPLAEGSALRIDGAAVVTQIVDTTLRATITINASVAEGALFGQLHLVDLAGNSTDDAVDTTVVVDRTAPQLQVRPLTTRVGRGGTFSLTIAADEPLATPPTAVRRRADGTGANVPVDVTDTGAGLYRLLSNVTDDDRDGAWNFQITTSGDLAGNGAGDVVVNDFIVDTLAPRFSAGPTVSDAAISQQPGHDATELTFVLDEPAENATVSLANGVEFPCIDDNSTTFTCAIAVDQIDDRGAVVVFIDVGDEAGNRAFSSVGLVVDTIPPTLLGSNVELIAPEGSKLDVVSSLAVGAQLKVAFTVDDRDASVVAVTSPALLTFAIEQPDASVPAFTASAAVPAGAIEGAAVVSLVLTDAVGNSTTANLQTVVVDTTAPAAPPVDVADRVVYRRVPWGSTATAGAPRFQLDLQDLDVGDTVFAWPQRDTTGAPLARGVVNGQGRALIDLGSNDRADVFVNVVDNGGNASPVVRVRDVAWTATLGRKVVGSTLENPHGFVQLGNTQDRLVVASANETGGAQTARADGVVTTTTAAIRFQKAGGLDTINSPSPLAAFDSARGRVVVLTGEDQQPQTWEHDGQQWQQIVPADPEGDGDPPNRQGGGGLAYHAARDVTLLFGGALNNGVADTWTWNGTSWALVERCISCAPQQLAEPALAYDDLATEVVMFGGTNRSTGNNAPPVDTTFLWDGGWRAVCAGDCPRPSARLGAMMAWDEARGVIVLFGGRDNAGSFNDVWEWDGAAWHEVDVSNDEGDGNPAARSLAAFAFDARRGELVLMGGMAGDTVFNDVWSFNGARFVRLNVTAVDSDNDGDNDPPGLRAPAAVSTTHGLQVVGGSGPAAGVSCGPGRCGGPWLLEGNTLVDGGLTTGPAARERPAVTFDRARGRVVMFGGSASDAQGPGGRIVDDVLWIWNGQRWERQQPAGARPSGREFTALTFDDSRDVVVLFGGARVGDCDGLVDGNGASVLCPSVVWEWDGAGWEKKSPVGEVPEARQGHSMVYDEVRHRVLLFGGQTATRTTCDGRAEVTCSTLWSWDGNAWQRLVPRDDEGDGNPPGRSVFLFAFDRARGETVLVSGDTGLFTRTADLNDSNDAALTWTWNGARWRRTSADRLITSILGGAAWYDPQRERVVAFGGKGPGDATAAVIEWDGASWSSARAVVDPEGDAQPIARQTPGAAFDEVNNVAIIFGGLVADPFTWLLHSSAAHSVGHQFDFTFAAAGAPADVTFASIDVDTTAGASGPAGSLLVWDSGWQTLVTGPLDGAARVSSNDDEIRRWLANPSSTLHLALRSPVGAARLETDAIAATIRYRLP